MQLINRFKHCYFKREYYSINTRFNKREASIREFELTLLKLKVIEDSNADWGAATHRITKENWAIRRRGLDHFWKALQDALTDNKWNFP